MNAIICVDDEPSILMALQQQMTRAFADEFAVEIAENADSAIELVQELLGANYRITTVVTDEMMPGMRGHQLIGEISKLSPDTNFVLLTGYIDAETIEGVKTNPKILCLSKPWEFDELVNAIRLRSGA
ncbi:MAG: response regulator [Flavobacteriales bacterium]